jgi:hypothetical protein
MSNPFRPKEGGDPLRPSGAGGTNPLDRISSRERHLLFESSDTRERFEAPAARAPQNQLRDQPLESREIPSQSYRTEQHLSSITYTRAEQPSDPSSAYNRLYSDSERADVRHPTTTPIGEVPVLRNTVKNIWEDAKHKRPWLETPKKKTQRRLKQYLEDTSTLQNDECYNGQSINTTAKKLEKLARWIKNNNYHFDHEQSNDYIEAEKTYNAEKEEISFKLVLNRNDIIPDSPFFDDGTCLGAPESFKKAAKAFSVEMEKKLKQMQESQSTKADSSKRVDPSTS